jgi:hypothetical protein
VTRLRIGTRLFARVWAGADRLQTDFQTSREPEGSLIERRA